MSEFRKELSGLLNRHDREIWSNTPDFILADFLTRCLEAFDAATRVRTDFWSSDGGSNRAEPPLSTEDASNRPSNRI